MPPQLVCLGGHERWRAVIGRALSGYCQIEPFSLDVPTDRLSNDEYRAVVLFPGQNRRLARDQLIALRGKLPHLPVFLFAEGFSASEVVAALRQGATDFLIPPLDEEEIRRTVLPHLQRRTTGVRRLVARAWQRVARLSTATRRERNAGKPPSSMPQHLGIVSDLLLFHPARVTLAGEQDIKIRFFGPLEITCRGKPTKTIPGRKVSSLLAFLLFHHHRPIQRDILMEKFWGETSPSSARNSLNVAIHHIRRSFLPLFPKQEFILFEKESYIVNPELEITSDVAQFRQYWQKGKCIEAAQGLASAIAPYNRAAGLFRGGFLEEFAYDEWCEPERDNLRETYLLILDRLSQYFFGEGAFFVCSNICKKMLEHDPCTEEAHRRLMVCYDQLGMRDRAIRQYFKCEDVLRKEFAVAPSDETRRLFEGISAGVMR